MNISKDIQQTKKAWADITGKHRPRKSTPSMPSDPEIEIYRHWLRLGKTREDVPHVLVLGATPELRDMALSENCQVTTIDINKEAVDAASECMTCKSSEKEIQIVGDWLTHPFEKSSFDMVLADAAFNNVPTHATAILFKRLSEMLVSNGFFITRNIVFLPERKPTSVEDLVNKYRSGNINQFDLYYELRFYSDIGTGCYDKKTRRSDWGKFFDELDKACAEGRLNKLEYESMAWQRSAVIHTMYNKEEWEEMIENFFEILTIEFWEEQFFSSYFPIYVLRNKK